MSESCSVRRSPMRWARPLVAFFVVIALATGLGPTTVPPASAAQSRITDAAGRTLGNDASEIDTTPPSGTVVIDGGAPYYGDPWAWNLSSYTIPDVRLTLNVQDVGPDLPLAAWAVSRDGTTWTPMPMTHAGYGEYEVLYDIAGMNMDEGTKKVWVRWQDAAGNWSDPATDTIILRYEKVGRVVVDDDDGYVRSFIVPVRFPVDVMPPEGIATVHVASNYLGCDEPPDCDTKSFPWSPGMVIQWDLRDPKYLGQSGNGAGRRVVAWWRSTTGRVSRMSQQWFIVDVIPPEAGPPRPTVLTGSTIADTSSASRIDAKIGWSSSSTGSPVAEQRLQQSTDSGTWTSVSLSTPTATSATRRLSPRSTYRFRTRTLDKAGNWSSWTTGSTFRVAPVQQTSSSVRYSGTWYTQTRADASGGSIRYARGKGAKATFTFTGRGIAIVAPRKSNGGEMLVYVDGALMKTVYLSASTYQPRKVVFSKSWSSSGTHTISIVKKYANADYPIMLDAFVVLK